jgi:hypothetical protein
VPRGPTREPWWLLPPFTACCLSFPVLTGAQDGEPSATARGLEALASDGSTVLVGEVTGQIDLAPARSKGERLGVIHVRAGLEFEAREADQSGIPAHVVGDIAGVLTVDETTDVAHLDALRSDGKRTLARVVLGDATFDDVPISEKQIVVAGRAPVAASLEWERTGLALPGGTVRLCARPRSGCITIRST